MIHCARAPPWQDIGLLEDGSCDSDSLLLAARAHARRPDGRRARSPLLGALRSPARRDERRRDRRHERARARRRTLCAARDRGADPARGDVPRTSERQLQLAQSPARCGGARRGGRRDRLRPADAGRELRLDHARGVGRLDRGREVLPGRLSLDHAGLRVRDQHGRQRLRRSRSPHPTRCALDEPPRCSTTGSTSRASTT